MAGQRVGYVRVSTLDQRASGKDVNRPQLERRSVSSATSALDGPARELTACCVDPGALRLAGLSASYVLLGPSVTRRTMCAEVSVCPRRA